MSHLDEKLSYIHGMMDTMNLDESDDTIKLIEKMVSLMDDVTEALSELSDNHQELNDYVESIDDDLSELEMRLGEDDDDFSLFDDDDGEEDDETPRHRSAAPRNNIRPLPTAASKRPLPTEEDSFTIEEAEDDAADEDEDEYDVSRFTGCICPECGRLFCVIDPEDGQRYICPYCLHKVPFTLIDPESIRIAEPAEDDE